MPDFTDQLFVGSYGKEDLDGDIGNSSVGTTNSKSKGINRNSGNLTSEFLNQESGVEQKLPTPVLS